MGSICTYSLPPGPFGKAHGISTCILLSCYSSPILMWFAPNSLKVVYLDMVFATGHPPTLGCISTTCRPETQDRREWAPAHHESGNPIPVSHVWFWKTLFKSRKKSWGERAQKDHSSKVGGKIQASERFSKSNLEVASCLEAHGLPAVGLYPGIRYHTTDQILQHKPKIQLEQRTASVLPKTRPQLAPETVGSYINGKADS